MAQDLVYKLKIPSKDVWFVQNTLENFDGLVLLTEAETGVDYCIMEAITNTDLSELFLEAIEALKEDIPTLILENS